MPQWVKKQRVTGSEGRKSIPQAMTRKHRPKFQDPPKIVLSVWTKYLKHKPGTREMAW